jgi:hypothetical protein
MHRGPYGSEMGFFPLITCKPRRMAAMPSVFRLGNCGDGNDDPAFQRLQTELNDSGSVKVGEVLYILSTWRVTSVRKLRARPNTRTGDLPRSRGN